jgi:hypothetical protein
MLSLPLVAPRVDAVEVFVRARHRSQLRWRLFASDPRGTWLPQEEVARGETTVDGEGWHEIQVGADVVPRYAHLALATDDPSVSLGASPSRLLGPLSWRSHVADLDAVAADRRGEGWSLPQEADGEWGDSVAFPFSYWRRDGHGWGGPPAPGIAFRVIPAQTYAPAASVLDPWERPTTEGVHAWVSAPQQGRSDAERFVFDRPQSLQLELPDAVDVAAVDVYFDSDLDRHLANIWYSHPPGFRALPTLLADVDIAVRDVAGAWRAVAEVRGNRRRRYCAEVDRVITGVRVTALATNGERSAAIMDVRLWSN